MLGQLDVMKAFLVAQPGAHRIRGPHSISLLAHARMGGAPARSVLELLESLGDVEDKPVPLSPEEAASLTGTFAIRPKPEPNGASRRRHEAVSQQPDVFVYTAAQLDTQGLHVEATFLSRRTGFLSSRCAFRPNTFRSESENAGYDG